MYCRKSLTCRTEHWVTRKVTRKTGTESSDWTVLSSPTLTLFHILLTSFYGATYVLVKQILCLTLIHVVCVVADICCCSARLIHVVLLHTVRCPILCTYMYAPWEVVGLCDIVFFGVKFCLRCCLWIESRCYFDIFPTDSAINSTQDLVWVDLIGLATRT